jgi:hypothetical protein
VGSSEHPPAAVARLVTHVDIGGDPADTRTMQVSARLEALLVDGRRLPLLDRGWSSSIHALREHGDPAPDPAEFPDVWTSPSVQEIEEDARAAVGPDEPNGGYSREEVEAGHWHSLAEISGAREWMPTRTS